jgi:hypothetical protein
MKRRAIAIALAGVLGAGLAAVLACAHDSSISAADFDHACVAAGDCAIVTEGDVCNACACANASIARRALDDFNARRSDLAESCATQAAGACSNGCNVTYAICLDGGCALTSVSPDAGDAADGG